MEQVEIVFIQILKILKVRTNEEFILNRLRNKNTFPSLASVNQSLKELSINTFPAQISSDQLNQIPYPAISHIANPKNELIILHNFDYDNKMIHYITTDGSYFNEHIENFQKKWNGIILSVEKTKSSGEKNYYIHKLMIFKEKIILLCSFLFFFIGYILLIRYSISELIISLLILKITGLSISWILFLKENLPGINILSKICKINNFFDCQKVLDSGVGKIFNLTNLAQLSVLYFTFTTFLLLFNITASQSLEILSLLLFLSILSLPIIIYSLYHQFKIKAFCLFCISTILILLIEIISLVVKGTDFFFSKKLILSSEFFFSLGIVSLVIVFTKELKRIWKKKTEEADQLNNVLLNTPGLFRLVMNNQMRKIKHVTYSNKIEVGDNNSKNTITLIVSPNCFYCKKVIHEIDKLISLPHKIVKINLYFFSTKQLSLFFIGIFLKHGSKTAWQAFLLFSKVGIEKLKKEFNLDDETLIVAEKIYIAHMNWCLEMGINSVPQIFINGVAVPVWIQHSKNLSTNIYEYLSE